MMFFKVITLITICAADDRLLLSELLSEQEVVPPVLPFKRQVIFPVIYTYAKRDGYSTSLPRSRSVRSAKPFRNLQYAPLREGPWDYSNPTPTHSNDPVGPTEMLRETKSRPYSKSHLEPRTEGSEKNYYASRHNKKAKASASLSPGHNAVYRIFSEPTQKSKGKPVLDYEKPIGINLDLESLISTTNIPLNDLTSDHRQSPLTLAEEHFVMEPDSLETSLPVQDKSKRYSSHPKYHRLHLNVARVYSPGQVPPKPPAYARKYPEHFGRSQKQQVFRAQTYHDVSENTILFPVKHNNRGNYRAHPSITHF